MKKPNLSKQFKMVLKAVEKRSPEILTGFGVAGMITTTVLAVKSTPKKRPYDYVHSDWT